MADEIIKTDPEGKVIEARMSRGIQYIEEVGEMLIVHYVDNNYVMRRIEIPRNEVVTDNNIDINKLNEAITKRVNEIKSYNEIVRKLNELNV